MISIPSRFAVLTIEQTPTRDGFRIRVTTDVPVHLFLRLTTVKPREHKIPRMSRGLFLFDDKYFCFVAYEDNDQIEVGDTLIHTYYKADWAICQTKYFYFHGTVNGQPSPSTSCIFEKHRILPPYWMIFDERWTTSLEPPAFTLIIAEPWTTSFAPPTYAIIQDEKWTS